jgi:hypothetical protein
MKQEHHHEGRSGSRPEIASTLNLMPSSRTGRIVNGQWPFTIDASSASHDQWIVDILSGCSWVAQKDTTHCRDGGKVLPNGKPCRLTRLHSVRCNSSSCRRKAARWRSVPPDLRGKYGYHHTNVLHFVRPLDFETHLAKGEPFGIPDFGGHDRCEIDHNPSGRSQWTAAVDCANMCLHDELSLHRYAIDCEYRPIKIRPLLNCCRLDFDLISDRSGFVPNLFSICSRLKQTTPSTL